MESRPRTQNLSTLIWDMGNPSCTFNYCTKCSSYPLLLLAQPFSPSMGPPRWMVLFKQDWLTPPFGARGILLSSPQSVKYSINLQLDTELSFISTAKHTWDRAADSGSKNPLPVQSVGFCVLKGAFARDRHRGQCWLRKDPFTPSSMPGYTMSWVQFLHIAPPTFRVLCSHGLP